MARELRSHDSDIGKPAIHEIGIPKLYSKRKKEGFFKVDPELWSRFKGVCAERGVSICHVLEALMEAWIQGQKAAATLVRPVIVNLTMEHVVQRPRRMQSFEDMVYECRRKIWPPSCEKADEFIKSTREVGCLEKTDFVPLDRCWRCFVEGQR